MQDDRESTDVKPQVANTFASIYSFGIWNMMESRKISMFGKIEIRLAGYINLRIDVIH